AGCPARRGAAAFPFAKQSPGARTHLCSTTSRSSCSTAPGGRPTAAPPTSGCARTRRGTGAAGPTGRRTGNRWSSTRAAFRGGLVTAATDDALRGDIDLAKALGFNGARKHQKVEDPRWLFWADVLGFLVWAEMPNAHLYSPEAAVRLAAEWKEAVLRDRDHPSVVAWGPVNESFGLGPPADRAGQAPFLVQLYPLTHAPDGPRPAR